MEEQTPLQAVSTRLNKVKPAVDALSSEITEMITSRIHKLVQCNDEEARGGIKALQELLELPVTLQHEHDHLQAGLPEEDPDF